MTSLLDLSLCCGYICAALIVAWALKRGLNRFKRPNGNGGGIVSLHVTAAFSIVTIIILLSGDWFIAGLAAVLAYLVAYNRIECGQHYLYQVILGMIIGIGVPVGLDQAWKRNKESTAAALDRIEYLDKPANARDDRHLADMDPGGALSPVRH